MVLRCFKSDEIIHVENSVDPLRDFEILNAELALKDLETLEKVWKKAEGEAKIGNKNAEKDLEALKQAKAALEAGNLLTGERYALIRTNVRISELNLLTTKKKIADLGGSYLVADLSVEPDLGELIKKAYEILGLISFFTTGEDETRAWTIKKNLKAPQAAGEIHSDLEKKFIRAEVINWQKLLEASSWNSAKQKGWLRLEGKEYEVQDGDVM